MDDHREVKVQYVRNALGNGHQSKRNDSLARQSSLKCVSGDDNVIIISDDAEDVDDHLAAWKCTNCGATNPGSVAECIDCLALQIPDSPSAEDARRGEAKVSGADGGKDDGKVEIMEHDRDEEIWICRRCTLQNVEKNIRCELCEAPRWSSIFRNRAVGSVTGHRQQSAGGEAGILDVDISKVQASGSSVAVDESDTATTRDVSEGGMQNGDWAVWTCNSCTYNNNPSWANFCDICETRKQVYNSPQKQTGIGKAIGRAIDKISVSGRKEKVATSWQCTKCLTVNANSVRDCNCCGALRMMTDAEGVQNTWTCTKCTLRNNSVAHVCAACLSKRNTALPQVDDIDTKWPCPKCTCINRSGQNLCQACGYDKKNPSNNRSDSQVSGKAKPDVARRRSVHIKEQQIKEEMAAHDQWMQIVSFCKVVSIFIILIVCMLSSFFLI